MSLIAWLDVSAEEQRRVRELVAMFSDKSTLDELGIGQVRDAFSDTLFPGQSTIQTRARVILLENPPRNSREEPRRWAQCRVLTCRVGCMSKLGERAPICFGAW